ncbi:MAG: xylulose 5-phosphate 3-epimerase [Dehalococcoidia bacterium]|nr:xylulose 5-phosphate 3-epimerase [Dehalococcoidia bacterium]
MQNQQSDLEALRAEEAVQDYRRHDPKADRWARGYGAIQHSVETQVRVIHMAESLKAKGVHGDGVGFFDVIYAADRITNAAMWLVVHMTYAHNVFLDGRDLRRDDFKSHPEGHTGGSLNMVPAYVGYLAANAITGITRSWIMGQGHCVAAIDSVNLLLDNMLAAHSSRYSLTDEGLTRYVRDFYSYQFNSNGRQDSPLGSHVNAHTAGGLAEGGYLGFVELQYVHMPLKGERLVAFLSDGAFEEQRGSDWAPRWWRAEDCGLVTPIMINNGRRIDQRTTMSQQGGPEWLAQHLRLNNFSPVIFDGADPAAFAWAIIEQETALETAGEAVRSGRAQYPVPLPYGIAVAPKGAGFYGAGTNLAHNLPLPGNPSVDVQSAQLFAQSARRLWVPVQELQQAVGLLQRHTVSDRPKERDSALAQRNVSLKASPPLQARPVPADRKAPSRWTRSSPMTAVDSVFLATVQANPHLRPRVGNPDEMRSNRLQSTLDDLRFRVTAPEGGIPEDVYGAVITALNEEAIASAALGNKGGINLVHTYEAFAPKMLGLFRQEITFTSQLREAGKAPGWLSVPLVLTSHTWENGKNELSHQDPTMAEAMLGEFSDLSRVVFPPDHNAAAETMRTLYQTRGQIWTLVVSKQDAVADLFTEAEAMQLMDQGAIRLEWLGYDLPGQRLVLTAIGSYQLEQVILASNRLADRAVSHSVVYMQEPGRFRASRNDGERHHAAPASLVRDLYPGHLEARVFLVHTRPEPMLGVLGPLNTGYGRTAAFGFRGAGGTLTVSGMLFVNGCTWGHVVRECSRVLGMEEALLLTQEERAALDGKRSPNGVII